jgi:hypothetical protein
MNINGPRLALPFTSFSYSIWDQWLISFSESN